MAISNNDKWIADYESVEFEQFIMERRPPTVEEAVDSIMRCILKSSRVYELGWYRQEYGDEFADKVEAIVKQKWGKKKK